MALLTENDRQALTGATMTEAETLRRAADALLKAGSQDNLRLLRAAAERPGATAAQLAADLGATKQFAFYRAGLMASYGLLARAGASLPCDPESAYRYSVTGVGLAVLGVVEAVRRQQAEKVA